MKRVLATSIASPRQGSVVANYGEWNSVLSFCPVTELAVCNRLHDSKVMCKV